jgi:hypothetical protein
VTLDAALIFAPNGALVPRALSAVGPGGSVICAGLRIQRALVWGLVYILIWEGVVAQVARGAARFSIQSYARSMFRALAEIEAVGISFSLGTSLVATATIALVALGLTVRWLQKSDVA